MSCSISTRVFGTKVNTCIYMINYMQQTAPPQDTKEGPPSGAYPPQQEGAPPGAYPPQQGGPPPGAYPPPAQQQATTTTVVTSQQVHISITVDSELWTLWDTGLCPLFRVCPLLGSYCHYVRTHVDYHTWTQQTAACRQWPLSHLKVLAWKLQSLTPTLEVTMFIKTFKLQRLEKYCF